MFPEISKEAQKLTIAQVGVITWWLKVAKWEGNVPTVPPWQIDRSTKQTRMSLYRRGILSEDGQINPVVGPQINSWLERREEYKQLFAEGIQKQGLRDAIEATIRERATTFSTLPELGEVQILISHRTKATLCFSAVCEVVVDVSLDNWEAELKLLGNTLYEATPDAIQLFALGVHQLGALLEHCLD